MAGSAFQTKRPIVAPVRAIIGLFRMLTGAVKQNYEVTKMDMKVENGKVSGFRTRVALSFKYEA